MNKLSIAIVGGDLRYIRLCNILIDKGFDVFLYGISHADISPSAHQCESINEITMCKYIIAPIPFSKDGVNVYTPLSELTISIEKFMEVGINSHVILGALKPTIKEDFIKQQIAYTDLMQMDEMAILNAIPTAEGAIQYAMQNSEITLHDSKCLVLGFGRCGKVLAHKLKGIGANVFVEARSTTDLAFISAYSYTPIPLHQLEEQLGAYDFIFNTIPVVLLTEKNIDLLNPRTVYIELASAPGGIDIEACHKKGVKHVPAPSLPGKVAPTTAAQVIYQSLELILRNQGEKL